MIQAISACPTTIVDIHHGRQRWKPTKCASTRLVDGLIDPNAEDRPRPLKCRKRWRRSRRGRRRRRCRRRWRRCRSSLPCCSIEDRRPGTLQDHQGHHAKMQKAAARRFADKADLKLLREATVRRADEYPLHLAAPSNACATACAAWSMQVRAASARSSKSAWIASECRAALHQSFPGSEINLDWADAEVAAAPRPTSPS